MTILLMLPNFNPLRRLEVFFVLAFYSRFHGRHYLAQITGSDVIGSTRKIPHG